MKIGVCYYPEHWPESRWREDATRMRDVGISVVRIGEFAWHRLEPADNQLDFDWLSRAMDTLHAAGLEIVLGTPTATPPKWLIDKYPEILASDYQGRTRSFGSRRHYCFSSPVYRQESQRIVTLLARHFGQHPALIAWQTDNEYGCHNTTLSYSNAAAEGFRQRCREQYMDINALNQAWANHFWSMAYNDFAEIDLPSGTTTEANPAHQLAFWRFSSDQVIAYNRVQVDVLRKHCPDTDVLHNFMGNFTEFDHHALSRDLDIATWDNYPLGFLDRDSSSDASGKQDLSKWFRTGHPDSSAFHHDLYRGMCNGRWWVMEQQPGPVNWAPHNPSPLPGMVRLWGLEAYAHGAEVMSYFRWRQLPGAQEQSHTGLCLSNGEDDVAAAEVRALAGDLATLQQHHDANAVTQASVAIIFDYPSDATLRIQQPGGRSGLHAPVNGPFDPQRWTAQAYQACRHQGQNIDVVAATAALEGYALVIVGCAAIVNHDLLKSLQAAKQRGQHILVLPRSGSKTEHFSIPPELPPGALQQLIDLQVVRSESLSPDVELPLTTADGRHFSATLWREHVRSGLKPMASFEDGWGLYYHCDRVHYLNAWLTQDSLNRFIAERLADAGVAIVDLDSFAGPGAAELADCGLRITRRHNLLFAFNYGPATVGVAELAKLMALHGEMALQNPALQDPNLQKPLVGTLPLQPAYAAVWQLDNKPA